MWVATCEHRELTAAILGYEIVDYVYMSFMNITLRRYKGRL